MDIWTVLGLIMIILFFLWLGYRAGIQRGRLLVHKDVQEMIPKIRKEAVEKSRQVLTGKFTEQLAPYLPKFPFSPTECRFLGNPVDFIVFKGMDNKEPEEIVFVEVKSGNAQLSTQERKLKNLVQEKKVSWYEYRGN